MSSSQTKYKATLAKALLDAIDELPGTERSRVLDRVAAHHVETIRQTPRTSWINAEHQLAVDTAIAEGLGDDALERRLRAYVSRARESPLFRPLISGAVSLFGLTPASLYRILPRAWDMTSRNAGVIYVRPLGDRAHEIRYDELPEVMRVPCLAVATRGSTLGILDIVGFDGAVETDVSALERGVLVHRVSWAAPR